MSAEVQNGPFRILALDGGGARGWLSARMLANVEALLNAGDDEAVALGRRFDLVIGTSTGAILAAGLACGVKAALDWLGAGGRTALGFGFFEGNED
jgi:patatin-like phospholipase/acyl hydrolase